MTEVGQRPYLRLVRANEQVLERTAEKWEQVQTPLLPSQVKTLGICTADALDESLLVSLINNLKPSLVLDLRTAPRFDFGTYNRKRALEFFQGAGANYRDIGFNIGEKEPELKKILETYGATTADVARGSVVVFLDAGLDHQSIGVSLIRELRLLSDDVWDLVLFGPREETSISRNIIFISHANPEDNDFTLWLRAQLTRLGYEVWSDLSHLKAGEIFWDTIEDVIRTRAARVIVVISKASMLKPGVLDEISLAVSVERSLQINGFVIPIRIDDVPYSDFRANIARKNIIDFTSGWANGLSRVLDTFLKDNVPRHSKAVGLSLTSWWAQQKGPLLSISNQPERLVSNRFLVNSMPARLYSYSGDPHFPVGTNAGNPFSRYKGLNISFFSPGELSTLGITGVTLESVLSASDTFEGNINLTAQASFSDRRRLRHGLLNRHWEHLLLAKGFRLYSLTGNQPTPFVPDGLIPKNTVYFRDIDGIQKRRLIVGYSTKRHVYWHLAPLGYFTTTSETALNLKMRVLFSEDGVDKWPSAERMRVMRRGFCKNWWNDRWRTVQAALLAFLSEDSENIVIYKGDAGTLSINSTAISFESPFSIQEQYADPVDEDLTLLQESSEPEDEDFELGDHNSISESHDGSST